MIRRLLKSTRTDTLVPYTTLFRSDLVAVDAEDEGFAAALFGGCGRDIGEPLGRAALRPAPRGGGPAIEIGGRIAVGLVLDRVFEPRVDEIGGDVGDRGLLIRLGEDDRPDRKSTRLNSSH